MGTEKFELKNEGNCFIRFCIVGGIGFVIDAGLLQIALMAGYGPFESRIFSIIIALTCTWLLHRHYTFKQTENNPLFQWSRFLIVGAVGAGMNFAIYSLILLTVPTTLPFISLVIASAIALSANYLGSRFFAFTT